MKIKLLGVILLALAVRSLGASYTNLLYSKTNIDYMLSTNSAWVSNNAYTAATTYSSSNLTYSISNLQWMTFSNSITTNLAVLTPGSNTVWLRITNGFTRDVTNAAP